MIKRFFYGFGFVFDGWRVLRQTKGIKRWVVLPWLLNFILFAFGIYYGFAQIQIWVSQAAIFIFGTPDSIYYSLLFYPALIIFWIVFAVLFTYGIYLLAGVMASPFYSVLTEKLIERWRDDSGASQGWGMVLKRAAIMLWVSILRAILLLAVGVLLFFLAFIPGLNLISTFGAFLLLALDSADFSFEALGFGLRQRLDFFRENFVEFCGMASFIGLIAIVPGLMVLIMPLAVLGATKLTFQLSRSDATQEKGI